MVEKLRGNGESGVGRREKTGAMHLPIVHLAGFGEDASEGQLQQGTQSGGSQEDEGSQSQSQSQGSGKEGSKEGKPPKDLPCPRCQSMNTKFCYYNNYSVNQPRHFCRNCQRYWTVGGTLRNVPVGGGSRKKSQRSRARSDPYYRPGNAAGAPEEAGHEDHGQHPAMARPLLHPEYPDFPVHPSSFLQLALQGQQSLGMPFPPFLDPPMSAEEEAELQALYDQSGVMSTAAAMVGSGLWVPELELMHKAALWGEAQRLQSMARRAQAAAWADQERECKPVLSPPVLQQRAPVEEPGQAASPLHRRPGFWETALMHSRPSKRPAGSSSSTPWDETSKPDSGDNISQNNNMVAGEGAYQQAGTYDVESTSWAPSNSEMFY